MSTQQANCSTYDLCGKYGDCMDDENDKWSCSCHFWWSGPVCDQFSSDGIQVIIMSCLLSILIVVYHGLVIHRSRKSKQSVQKYSITAVVFGRCAPRVKFSYTWSSCVVLLLVPVLTAFIIVIQWIVTQKFHAKRINEHHTNGSLFYEAHPICQVISYHNFNLILLPVACLLTIVFSIPYKTFPWAWGRCTDLYRLPIPIDFFTGTNRRLVAAIFALTADQIFEIVRNALSGSSESDSGIILTFLQENVRCLAMALRHYPLLVAVYIKSLFSLILATLYILLDLAIMIIMHALCPSNSIQSGPLLFVADILRDTPRFLCMSYIIVALIKTMCQKYRYRSKISPNTANPTIAQEENGLLHFLDTDSAEMIYVRNLFRLPKKRITYRWLYQWRDDFRFSARIMCVYCSIFLFLYIIVIEGCISIPIVLTMAEHYIQVWIRFQNNTDIALPNGFLVRGFFISFTIGLLVIIIQLFVLLANIRRNLLQAFRGDFSEIPPPDRTAYVHYAVDNVHFAGYLMGYALWGLVLIVVGIFIPLVLVSGMLMFCKWKIVESFLKHSIPLLLLIYFKDYLNKCFIRFLFLQHDGTVLAVKNRRFFMVFLYFNFYVDVLLGFYSCILRLAKSVIVGAVYMCRLDYSPLGRKLETHDDGFSAYCGFIHTECVHRHPILLVFAAFLLQQKRDKKRSTRTLRRWHRTMLLLKNRSLMKYRKSRSDSLHRNQL